MPMSEITTRLKSDISDALKRVAGRLSFRKKGRVARLLRQATGLA